MKGLLLTLIVGISTIVTADSLNYKQPGSSGLRIGEEQVTMTVVFSTQAYHLDQCADSDRPHGFYIAEREDTKRLLFYCGTAMGIGDTFTILVEKGI